MIEHQISHLKVVHSSGFASVFMLDMTVTSLELILKLVRTSFMCFVSMLVSMLREKMENMFAWN